MRQGCAIFAVHIQKEYFFFSESGIQGAALLRGMAEGVYQGKRVFSIVFSMPVRVLETLLETSRKF